jgi:putative transposase
VASQLGACVLQRKTQFVQMRQDSGGRSETQGACVVQCKTQFVQLKNDMPNPARIRRRSINEPGHAHELTFSCYHHFPFLKRERTCKWLAAAIEQARAKHSFDLWAYSFMPEHVHLIVFPRQPEYEIRRILAGIKQPVARRAIDFLNEQNSHWLEKITRKRGTRVERLFWQSGGGYDRNITSSGALCKMLDYLHLNPVRRGLVERAADWKWSSAAWFEGGSSPIPLDVIPSEWLTT